MFPFPRPLYILYKFSLVSYFTLKVQVSASANMSKVILKRLNNSRTISNRCLEDHK